MNKNIIRQNEKEFLEAADTLLGLNPYAHIASFLTSWAAIFLLITGTTNRYDILQQYPLIVNSIATIIGFAVAIGVESQFARLSTSFAKMIVLSKGSKRIAFVFSIAVTLLGSFTVATSAMGAKESVVSTADNVAKKDLASISAAATDTEIELKKIIEVEKKNYLSQRNEAKKDIREKYFVELESAIMVLEHKYHKKDSDPNIQKEYSKQVAKKQKSISSRESKEIQSFNEETKKGLKDIDRGGKKHIGSVSFRNEKVVSSISRKNKSIDEWVQWAGGVLSGFVVLLIVFSVMVKVSSYYLYYIVKGKFPNKKPSPTLLGRLKKLKKTTQKAIFGSGGGVKEGQKGDRGGVKPEFKPKTRPRNNRSSVEIQYPSQPNNEVDELKSQIIALNKHRNDESLSSAARGQASSQMHYYMNKLYKRHGIGMQYRGEEEQEIIFADTTFMN